MPAVFCQVQALPFFGQFGATLLECVFYGMWRTFRYRMYPSGAQAKLLNAQVDEACRLYNAALEERRSAWRMNGIRVTYYNQANQLKSIRAAGHIGVA